MSLREKLNQRPSIITAATLAIIVIAMGLIIWQVIRGSHPPAGRAYFTIDDGATFFEADNSNIPPFTHNGKTAYKAHVFSCDGGATKFVGYVERFTPEARKTIEAAMKRPDDDSLDGPGAIQSGSQIKLPRTGTDDSKWVLRESPEGEALLAGVKCDKEDQFLEPIEPEVP